MFTDHKFFKDLNVFSDVKVKDSMRFMSVRTIMSGHRGKAGVYFAVYETEKVYSIDDIVEIDNK